MIPNGVKTGVCEWRGDAASEEERTVIIRAVEDAPYRDFVLARQNPHGKIVQVPGIGEIKWWHRAGGMGVDEEVITVRREPGAQLEG